MQVVKPIQANSTAGTGLVHSNKFEAPVAMAFALLHGSEAYRQGLFKQLHCFNLHGEDARA